MGREIDDEIRRVIEEAHERARKALQQHMDELHKISGLLIERETIDKDQFERLLAGESADTVFPEEKEKSATEEEPERKPRTEPKPRPFPLPGATMQPPPEPAEG
jgi:cell division protease FtsH